MTDDLQLRLCPILLLTLTQGRRFRRYVVWLPNFFFFIKLVDVIEVSGVLLFYLEEREW